MKILHYSNLIFYITTIATYVFYDVTVGLIFQFFFGIIQLMYFFICLKHKKSKSINKHLKAYLLAVIATFLIYVILYVNVCFSKTIRLVFFICLPMTIASYFVTITYLIQKQ